jgi:Domain of unknown function (DUF2017)
MSAGDRLFAPGGGGGVEVRLPSGFRDVLRSLCDQLEALLTTEDRSSDPALARLSPAAYPDDPLRELEFEQMAGDDLAAGRLAALREVRSTAEADVLDEEQALAWLRTLNDLRLVLGTRLDVTEESGIEDFADEASASTFKLYGALGMIQGELLLAIDPEAVEPEDLDPPG